MRRPWLVVCLLLVAACGDQGREAETSMPAPTAPPRLTARDLRTFLVVRAKALERIEAGLAALKREGGDVTMHIEELKVAEREAAEAVGTDWRRYVWVRERIGQLLAVARQREDRRLLVGELERTRKELASQMVTLKDPGVRGAVEARLASVQAQLKEIRGEQRLSHEDAEELRLVTTAQAELATLDRRQETVQKKLQGAVKRAPLPGAQQEK
jgi:hypothetical protein